MNYPPKACCTRTELKPIQIRPFTFDDERLLKTIHVTKKDPDVVIDTLLRNCSQGLPVEALLPHDRLYVLYRLRGISYGDDYPLTHVCGSCDAQSELNLKISTLEITPLTREHMVFTLPDSEQEAEIKLPGAQDQDLCKTVDAAMTNMHMFIYRIGDVRDKTVIEAFIRKTTVRDIDTLRTHIFTPAYGMESFFHYNCQGCGFKNRVEIELTGDFFTAS